MADKPEKITISHGKKPASSPGRNASGSSRKNRIEPLGKKAESTPPVSQPEETILDDQISNKLEPRPRSSGVDGGFAADMSEQSQRESGDEQEDIGDVSSRQPEVAPQAQSHADTDEEHVTDTVYTDDDDFYSSKLDPEHIAAHSEKSKPKKGSVRGHRISAQYLLVLATFVTITLVGLFILHELEQAREGAGLIFDWLK